MMTNEFIFEIILLILKVVIILLWITDIYFKYVPSEYQFIDIQKEKFWAVRVSFVFEILIGFLLIYLFNPFHFHQLTKLTKLTLFTFGIMTVLSADWSKFISESSIINYL